MYAMQASTILSDFGQGPCLLSELSERSITPTNCSARNELEISEFSFDIDDFLNEIDVPIEASGEGETHDARNILDEYISELTPLDSDELGEDCNSTSFGSSIVSSTDGDIPSYFDCSYNALDFVEKCSQEILNMHLNPADMEVDIEDNLSDVSPLAHPLANANFLRHDSPLSYYSPMLSPEFISIPQGIVSGLGSDIMYNHVAKPLDPKIAMLKENLSKIQCFESTVSQKCQTEYFDFSTQSPDDVIRGERINEPHKI